MVDTDVRIRIQRGKIHRNFAKVGVMDPFVILSPNSEPSKSVRAKIAKSHNMISAADSGGHFAPKWNWDFPSFKLGASREIVLDVYDRNQYHKNTYIGTAQVGLTEICSGSRMVRDYPCAINKHGEETGIIWLTVVSSSQEREKGYKSTKSGASSPSKRTHIGQGASFEATPSMSTIGASALRVLSPRGKREQDLDSQYTSAMTEIYPASIGSLNETLPSMNAGMLQAGSSKRLVSPKIQKEHSCIDTLGRYLFCK